MAVAVAVTVEDVEPIKTNNLTSVIMRKKSINCLALAFGAGLNFLVTGILWPAKGTIYLNTCIVFYLVASTIGVSLAIIGEARRVDNHNKYDDIKTEINRGEKAGAIGRRPATNMERRVA